MKNIIYYFVIVSFIIACNKDCLKKEQCFPNSYSSDYLIEQTLPTTAQNIYYIDAEDGKSSNSDTQTSYTPWQKAM